MIITITWRNGPLSVIFMAVQGMPTENLMETGTCVFRCPHFSFGIADRSADIIPASFAPESQAKLDSLIFI